MKMVLMPKMPSLVPSFAELPTIPQVRSVRLAQLAPKFETFSKSATESCPMFVIGTGVAAARLAAPVGL